MLLGSRSGSSRWCVGVIGVESSTAAFACDIGNSLGCRWKNFDTGGIQIEVETSQFRTSSYGYSALIRRARVGVRRGGEMDRKQPRLLAE